VLTRAAMLLAPCAAAAALLAPAAGSASLAYPIPRSSLSALSRMCIDSVATEHARFMSVTYSTYRVVCRFTVSGGRAATIAVTRPSRCVAQLALSVNAVLVTRRRISFFC